MLERAIANDRWIQRGRAPTSTIVGTHTINLDTDEGSWISLDVSPDGKLVVFTSDKA